MDRKKLVAEAPPFDGKKNCWVVDEKDGFVAGEIVSTKGDEVTVQLSATHLVSTQRSRSARGSYRTQSGCRMKV